MPFLGNLLKSNSSILSSLDTDYSSDAFEPKQKTLLDMCMDVMLSDVCMLRQSEGSIPPSLHIKLTLRALETCRVLSVRFLIERFPIKEFVLPFPETLKHCTVLLQHVLPNHLWNQLLNVRNNASIVSFAFLNAIKHKNTMLRVVDFNQLPLEFFLLMKICLFVIEDISDTDQYEIRGNFMFLKDDHFTRFCQVKEKLHSKLKLTLTGMHIGHIPMKCKYATDVFELLDAEDLHYLYMGFCTKRLPQVIAPLRRFQNLTSLFITYITFSSPEEIDDLADVLYRLPLLTRLGLSGSTLKNSLGSLLLKNCKRDHFSEPKRRRINSQCEGISWIQPDCCVVHRGKLESLDISGCQLSEEDLECLKRYPLCDNLKYLNLADNFFQAQSLSEFLESIVPNILVLNVENSLKNSSHLTPFFNTLGKFMSLEYIVIGKLLIERHHILSLSEALCKIPNLKEVHVYCPPEEKQEDLEASLNLKKNVKLVWLNLF